MVKRSTLLITALFSLLLGGFIVFQFNQVQSSQKDKLQDIKTRFISGINDAGQEIASTGSLHALTDTAVANLLHRSFSAKGLGNVPFEFSIDSGDHHLASRGFNKKLIDNSSHLTFYYIFQPDGGKTITNDPLIVIVPDWKKLL
jgi:hypothetical protein